MSTNAQIIGDALSLLKVIAEGETPSAEHSAHGLRKLNQMLATWEVDGIALGYHAQTDATATCPIPDWAEKGVYGSLAIEVAADYGAQLSAEAMKTADDGYTLILRRIISLGMQGSDMSHLGAGGGRYNINTDTF